MQIDQVTKADEFQVLRYDFLNYPLEELVYADSDPRELIWLFTDPVGDNHLISRSPHPLLPARKGRSSEEVRHRPEGLGEVKYEQLSLVCSNLLANQL
jgi:hypothetical protein